MVMIYVAVGLAHFGLFRVALGSSTLSQVQKMASLDPISLVTITVQISLSAFSFIRN